VRSGLAQSIFASTIARTGAITYGTAAKIRRTASTSARGISATTGSTGSSRPGTGTTVTRPTFYYNPGLFWDPNPAHAKATVHAGPNSPIGVVWIDLTKEHYGLHGTPEPGRIGYPESHGCVRLTNWDAQRVAALVQPGTRVVFR
jgi:lipoprotein-anchoring transpeptidase ErfK/SrfK